MRDTPPENVMARLTEPTTDDRTRLAVVADPHVATRAEGTSKLFEHTREHFAAAVADAGTRDVDAVVSVGDLTKDGEPWNYEAVDEVLTALDVPFLAVPGNHDVPKAGDEHDTMSVRSFAKRYADVETGPDEDGDGYPVRTRVGGVDLIGLNSAGTATRLNDSHEGEVPAEDRDFLESALADADAPVVLTHHNLPAMYDRLRAHRDAVEPEMFIPPTTREGDAFVDSLTTGGAPLVLTGHLHMPATVATDGVREVMVPTTCSFPQAYCLVDVGPEGTTVRMVPVADEAGLRTGYAERSTDSTTARGLTAVAAINLARFPLVDERTR
jgi:3',5'-cyclic AMP phosphodiesterase CpdA